LIKFKGYLKQFIVTKNGLVLKVVIPNFSQEQVDKIGRCEKAPEIELDIRIEGEVYE